MEKEEIFQNSVLEVKVEGCYEREHLVKCMGLFHMKANKKAEEKKFLENSSDEC